MLALIDTGAGITVASQSILALLGIYQTNPCAVPSGVGMAGIPVRFIGSAPVDLRIGNQSLTQVVYFTESECIPRAADAYNIILGNDTLQRLPLWALNYEQRTFLVGDEPIPILTFASGNPPPSAPIVSTSTAVRALFTVILRPASETLVPCYIVANNPRWSIILASANVLPEDEIMAAPAVFHKDKANSPSATRRTRLRSFTRIRN